MADIGNNSKHYQALQSFLYPRTIKPQLALVPVKRACIRVLTLFLQKMLGEPLAESLPEALTSRVQKG